MTAEKNITREKWYVKVFSIKIQVFLQSFLLRNVVNIQYFGYCVRD